MKETSVSYDALAVDDATFARWKAEARACPPNIDDWAHLVALLRLSAAIDSHGSENPELPGAGIISSECALRAVVSFLQKQPHLDQHGEAVGPLGRLHMALHDLTEGKLSPMFKPVRLAGVPGAPGNRAALETIKGLAARAITELHEGGEPLAEAAKQVAAVLQKASKRERGMKGSLSRKGFGQITEATVKNWRARIMEGQGPGASEIAVFQYKAALPPGMGTTPRQRGVSLLIVLRNRAASVI